MIFDSHSHTRVAADSEMEARAALRAAEALGIGLVFTEHLDVDFPGEDDFTFDPAAYWETYAPLRGERLRLGVEVGMTPETCAASRAFVARAPFDLVIGSIHVLDGQDLYYPAYYEAHAKEEAYTAYFAQVAAWL